MTFSEKDIVDWLKVSHRNGDSFRQMARATGISYATLFRLIKKQQKPTPQVLQILENFILGKPPPIFKNSKSELTQRVITLEREVTALKIQVRKLLNDPAQKGIE